MVFLVRQREAISLCHQISRSFTNTTCRLQSTKSSKPLRVLFCGSDEFSCASLRAVHQERLRDSDLISSIDVLLRPGKPSGRGLKSIREVPIKRVAEDLGLSVHQRDTFTGWTLPTANGQDINLIIAVSFGLFVPPRILKSAEYGGINLHPSFLPDFRGPAPLYHTLLAGETHTGITLQTLHPGKFDHGTILAQTPLPGLKIPNAAHCTYPGLLDFITPKAAEMLVQGLRDRVFVPPLKNKGQLRLEPRSLRAAPKITTADRQVSWKTMIAEDILRRDRVLGRLWSYVQIPGEKTKKRIVFEGFVPVHPESSRDCFSKSQRREGNGFLVTFIEQDDKEVPIWCHVEEGRIIMPAANGSAVQIEEVTVEGSKRTSAAKALPTLGSHR